MNRKIYIDKITKYLSLFVQEVKTYNATLNYDINIHAENALIPILNGIFEINLKNANESKRNFPAIDLYDAKNRIAFQITATSTAEKVISTLESFISKELYKEFDTLYIYILTEKNNSYPKDKISKTISNLFDFDPKIHIIDFADIIIKINYIQSLEKLNALSRIFEHEFSEIQINSREKIFKDGYLKNEPEDIYLNILEIKFSQYLYIADLRINEKFMKEEINEYRKGQGWRPKRVFKKEELVNQHLSKFERYTGEWILKENKIITFIDINKTSEPLNKIVDLGTITMLASAEYYNQNDDYLNNFKFLLKKCLKQMASGIGMEWIKDRKIIRFRNNEAAPRKRQIRWKGKNEATKTVIFEMASKPKEDGETHIICFRNMAFKPTFHLINDIWYLSINPTWSFTNPYGFRPSKFESSYMAGLKRQENNNAVYYQFRFFGYYLSYSDLFSKEYLYLKIVPIPPLIMTPKIEDSKWKPIKDFKPKNVKEAELEIDNELTNNLF